MANLENTLVNGDVRVTGNVYGKTIGAEQLFTPRTAYVSLNTVSSTTTIDWSGNAVIPVNGTLGVANGGTGLTTMTYKNAVLSGNTSSATGVCRAIRTSNGALYATDTDAAASFGTLPITCGGTNATTVEGARTNLSIYSTTEASTLINSRWPIYKKQSTDFTNWDQFTDTGLYEIGGQPSGVFNSPESGRMTLYVIKSICSTDNKYTVTQLAIGNYVYRRIYMSETASWSAWSMVNGDVTFTLGALNDSGNVGLSEMKKTYALTKRIAILVGGTIDGSTSGSLYWLTDVVYNSNNEIASFHFSRPNPDTTAGTGETVKYVLSSSGWSRSALPVKYATSAWIANRVQNTPFSTNVTLADRAGSDREFVYISSAYAKMQHASRTLIVIDNGFKVYAADGTLVDSGTINLPQLPQVCRLASSYKAINIHLVVTGYTHPYDIPDTVILRSYETAQDLVPGCRYNIVIQNVGTADMPIRFQIGGRYDEYLYYDYWDIYHDGHREEYYGVIDDLFSNYHTLGTVQTGKSKSWEIIWEVFDTSVDQIKTAELHITTIY